MHHQDTVSNWSIANLIKTARSYFCEHPGIIEKKKPSNTTTLTINKLTEMNKKKYPPQSLYLAVILTWFRAVS